MQLIKRLLFAAAILLAGMSVVYAEHIEGKPGDDFRKTAQVYAAYGSKMAAEARNARGDKAIRYQELSAVYREMADIKSNAAELADKHRWNDVNWDRYHQLASQRDMLLGQLAWDNKQELSAERHASGAEDYIRAAEVYRHEARQARDGADKADAMLRGLYGQLANVYDRMADIKQRAASRLSKGQPMDWSHYHRLELKRDQLTGQLGHAKR